MPITHSRVAQHAFLDGLYRDGYFPDHVVDKGRAVLLALCARIEAERPADLAALYRLTQGATEEFNALEAEFEAAGSEIETVGPRGDGRRLLVRRTGLRLRGRGHGGADRHPGVVTAGPPSRTEAVPGRASAPAGIPAGAEVTRVSGSDAGLS